ncbi:secreted salivary gland peptide, putative [Ixodes scapularis]|uniref:Secreted salivary gland peptide, putative n=1 Tax=Ixodes scapularis TaxID=6945 RepID=B7Q1M8_IXOSC|nr:secreted salivary gland peptide, putative [Ixodes scapularis]|eukprot:XP_002409842.1 secreted salivary gland peptide, putative [Ixodes scapularis]
MLLLFAVRCATAYDLANLPNRGINRYAMDTLEGSNSGPTPRYVYMRQQGLGLPFSQSLENGYGHSLTQSLSGFGGGSGGHIGGSIDGGLGGRAHGRAGSRHIGQGVPFGLNHGVGQGLGYSLGRGTGHALGHGIGHGFGHGLGHGFGHGLGLGQEMKHGLSSGFDPGRGIFGGGLHDEFSYGESKVIQGPTYLVHTYGGEHERYGSRSKSYAGKSHRGGHRNRKVIVLKERDRHGH